LKSDVKISENRVQITRIFNAPRSVVFGYWTRPEKLQQWSGCKGATKCEVTMDFRVGGTFTQKMQIQGAGEFTFSGIYEEIIDPERIVYSANLGFATSRIRVEFIEQGRRTKVVLTQDGLPDQNFCKIISEGTSEGMEKLDELLAGQAV
jgi:uncharacterized protein YndB with AHSA1/START domain